MHASSIFIMDYYELNMSGGPLWLYDGGQPWKSGWHYDYNLGNDLYKWNHFCLTRTDSGFRYYINGNLICSRGNMWTNTNDYEVVIGNRAVSYFDNIFVSDIGLEVSSFEITKPVGSIDSLLLFNDNNVYGRVDNK